MSVVALHLLADGDDEVIDLADWAPRKIPRDELLWIDTVSPSPDEVASVGRALALSDGVAALLGDDPGGPDTAVLADAVSIVVSAPGAELDDDPVALRILVGDEWVVTCRRHPIAFVDEHIERVRDERGIGLITPVQFLVAILDWMLDAFFRVSSELEAEVDRLDDAALLTERSERDLLRQLVAMRRRIARARRHLTSLREVFAELARPDFLPNVEEHERQALGAVIQRLDRATDAVANVREMLIGTFGVHMTRTAQRTNDIMKILTIVSVILLPASVIAGVMGMNFRVGFFDDPTMFWVVVTTMLAIALGTIGLARWRGWL